MVQESSYSSQAFPITDQTEPSTMEEMKAHGLIHLYIGQRHQGRANYLFADGHVKLLALR
jgi:prepilin-type processing-associated H-X9-DG protein